MAKKRHGRSVAKIVAGVILAVIAYFGLQYGAMLKDMDAAASQYSAGNIEGALKTYENVEARLRRYGAMRLIPQNDRESLFLNQARLLYAMKRYDDAAERLEREDEITGMTADGRFYLLRGEISFRRAFDSYEQSTKKDVNLLEENLQAAEDILRESLRLAPVDWDAKYNFEYVDMVRKSLTGTGEGKVKFLQQEEKPAPKQLPPESAG
jgi:tetratricopeptide (TPR) repeat protein